MRVRLPDYRLSPEYEFPDGVDDALAVYSSLLATGADRASVVVGGDDRRPHGDLPRPRPHPQQRLPLPAAVVVFSPVADPTATAALTADLARPADAGRFMRRTPDLD